MKNIPFAVAGCLIIAVFGLAIVYPDQGRDLLRSTQEDAWAGLRFYGAIGLLLASIFGCVPALFAGRTVGKEEPNRSGFRESELGAAEAACAVSMPAGLLLAAIAESVFSLEYFLFILVYCMIGALAAGQTLVVCLLARVPWLLGAVGLGCVLAIASAPAQIGEWLGSALTLAVGLAGWQLLLVGLSLEMRGSSTVRWVVLAVVLVVIVEQVVLYFLVSPRTDTIRGDAVFRAATPLDEALRRSVKAQGTASPTLIIVAAAGGGIRASYWTSKVLTHVVDSVPSSRPKFFIASGVSGGSVGLALFRSLLAVPNASCSPNERTGPLESCSDKFHEQDFLAGILGATVTSELINVVLPILPARSVALERTWEARWRALITPFDTRSSDLFSAPMRSHWSDTSPRLSLVLNTTSIYGGDRMPVSDLRTEWMHEVGPCKVNIAEQVDLPLSTAANSSARFPGLEDWGWFPVTDPALKGRKEIETGCKDNEGIADGGFFDNFGAATALEAYNAVKQLAAALGVKPKIFVIQISSDPVCGTAHLLDERPDRLLECRKIRQAREKEFEIVRPNVGLFSEEARKATSHNSRIHIRRFLYPLPEEQVPGVFGVAMQASTVSGIGVARQLKRRVEADPDSRFYHFSLSGALDAPLEWALSGYARKEIDGLLLSDGVVKDGANKREMDRLIADLSR